MTLGHRFVSFRQLLSNIVVSSICEQQCVSCRMSVTKQNTEINPSSILASGQQCLTNQRSPFQHMTLRNRHLARLLHCLAYVEALAGCQSAPSTFEDK